MKAPTVAGVNIIDATGALAVEENDTICTRGGIP
jgi:hypothetical protein